MYELLAPAGDMECIYAALRFGADAVYLGGPKLQLRSSKSGFDETALKTASALLHENGRKMYVTVNSFAKNDEIPDIGDYAKMLYDLGTDAVIVSDIGVLAAIKASVPDLSVHISTQANCMNYASARTYHDLGADRIVLARELTLEDIAVIRAKTPKELTLEAFVHGAMCMSYSGRCLISAFLNNRSGNRGECTQPCRWNYRLVEEKRPGVYIPVIEDDKGTAILSSYDLCCIEFLDEMKKAGIESFKIEGRMKTAYYVATAVNAYRRRLDGISSVEYCRNELDCVSHRPYSSGFYFGYQKDSSGIGDYISSCGFAAVVQDTMPGKLKLRQRNNFKVGDTLEILSPFTDAKPFTLEEMFDEGGEAITAAPHPEQTVFIKCPFPAEPGDIIRRRNEI